jgi:stage II sporulation protein R
MKFASKILPPKKSFFIYCGAIICTVLLFVLVFGLHRQEKTEPLPLLSLGGEQGAIKAEDIIRFHVRAHSNSPEEQRIKNHLAKEILSLYAPRWRNCSSKEELRSILTVDKKDLEMASRKILAESGFGHDVRISLQKSFFPARLYEGKFYPPGEYEALTVFIGDGGGENWWCVLFPPLCFNVVPVPPDEGTHSPAVEEPEEKDESSHRLTCTDKENAIKKPACRFWIIEMLAKLVSRFIGV